MSTGRGQTLHEVTPLYVAMVLGHMGVAEKLVNAGADLNKAETISGASPLHIAADNGHEVLFRLY